MTRREITVMEKLLKNSIKNYEKSGTIPSNLADLWKVPYEKLVNTWGEEETNKFVNHLFVKYVGKILPGNLYKDNNGLSATLKILQEGAEKTVPTKSYSELRNSYIEKYIPKDPTQKRHVLELASHYYDTGDVFIVPISE